MSEHRTGLSNWTTEQKQLYRERRDKGLRGQTGIVTVHQVVKDEEGNEQRVPIGTRVNRILSRGKSASRSQTVQANQKAHMAQQRKASSRGE